MRPRFRLATTTAAAAAAALFLATTCSATCYFVDGSPVSKGGGGGGGGGNFQPCRANTTFSQCCVPGQDICTANGLCTHLAPKVASQYEYRPACSKQDWTGCQKVCPGVNPNSWVQMKKCPNGQYCCVANPQSDCCSLPNAKFDIAKNPAGTVQGGGNGGDSSGGGGGGGSSSSPIGPAVGGAVGGVVVVVGSGVAIWLFLRRRKKNKGEKDGGGGGDDEDDKKSHEGAAELHCEQSAVEMENTQLPVESDARIVQMERVELPA